MPAVLRVLNVAVLDWTNTIFKTFLIGLIFHTILFSFGPFSIDPHCSRCILPTAQKVVWLTHADPSCHYASKYLKALNTHPHVFHLTSAIQEIHNNPSFKTRAGQFSTHI